MRLNAFSKIFVCLDNRPIRSLCLRRILSFDNRPIRACPITSIFFFLAPKRTATICDVPSTLAESSGGLAFEVKLAESPRHGTGQPPVHFLSPSAKGNQNDLISPLTPESITEKLKRAEERRLSLEQLRATLLAAENNRPVEVIKIKDQQTEGMKEKKIRKLIY